jgi:hypothetical protein
MKLQYETLAELQQGYKSGEKLDPITLDNDQTTVYTSDADDDEDSECVFELHPDQLLEQALDLLGIPHQGA